MTPNEKVKTVEEIVDQVFKETAKPGGLTKKWLRTTLSQRDKEIREEFATTLLSLIAKGYIDTALNLMKTQVLTDD